MLPSGTGNPDSTSPTALATERVNPLRAGWEHWKRMAHAVGVVQTRFLMVIFYFAVVLPTGIFMRLSQDRLRLAHPDGSCWIPHKQEEPSIETARRQF